LPEIFKEKDLQAKTHDKFSAKYGGKVIYIYSSQQNKIKDIVNIDVVEEIQVEIKRLSE